MTLTPESTAPLKQRKRRKRSRPKWAKKKARLFAAPLKVEDTPSPDLKAVDEYLTRFNNLFGVDAKAEKLPNAKPQLLEWLHYLRQQGVVQTDIPLLLHDSLQYAMYRIGQKFGLIDEDGPDSPLINYGTVGSRFIEVMER